MNALCTHASRWLLGLAVYLMGWYFEGGAGQALQATAVCLLLLAGFMSALSGGTLRIPISRVEALFAVSFAFAMLVAVISANFLSFLYGFMFLLVLVAVGFLVRHKEADQLLGVFRGAYMALLCTLLVIEPGPLFRSLGGSVEYGIGLVRYEPLGMHPNLAGLVYGGGILLFAQHFLATSKTMQKVFAGLMAILCAFVLLAAAARASMLALGVSCLVGTWVIASGGSGKARLLLVLGALLAILMVVLKWDAIAGYLTIILDLESDTRGLASGATGRAVIWLDGINLVFSDLVLMVTGRGVRSVLPEVIGFPVESSYINLALEHGIVLGSLMVLAFMSTAWRSVRFGVVCSLSGDYKLLLLGLILVYVLAQSIFNRYLVAVGNPFSTLVIVLLVGLNFSNRLNNA